MSPSPFEVCPCGCWDWLPTSPAMQTWMALYLDTLDREGGDVAQRMLMEQVIVPALRKSGDIP